MTKKMVATAAVLGLTVCLSGGAHATELVTNGNFELTNHGPGQIGYNTTLTGWTGNGYNFVFAPNTADTTGVTSQYGHPKLWGPHDGSANGFTATSPDGGNFVAGDGAFQVGALKQTIHGLSVGSLYDLEFDWAGIQQYTFNGATTEDWIASLGAQSHTTNIVSIPTHGFSGWQHATFHFTATSTSEVLSFLAHGTPGGEPPFSLLDGVSLKEISVPEPSSIASMFIGALGLGFIVTRRARSAKKSAA